MKVSRFTFIVSLGLIVFAAGCGNVDLPFFAAETPTPTLTPTLAPSATATITPSPTITPTFTPSPIPTATWVVQGPKLVRIPIILYHRIAVSPINSNYYVPPEHFEEQIKLLHDWGYATITTQMLVQAIQEGIALPPRPILITFDDGVQSVYDSALPVMQKYGFTGVAYIVNNYMNSQDQTYMRPDQVKQLAAAGWEIGSHSLNHIDLTRAPERQRNEVVESRKQLEAELGIPVLTFAYPFGSLDSSAVDYVHYAGYIAAMGLGPTVDQGIGNLFNLQRRDIKGSYDLRLFASFLPWQGDPAFLPTITPTPTP
jgi:peptidoglycan/xylan/chitin deacetylase (PgdA/CDA1 family)